MRDNVKKCLQARQYYDAQLAEDPAEALTPEVKGQMESHLSTCNDCQIWQRQITDIIAEAAHIPQFDVPEALTQRIMTRVTEESVKQESSWTTVIMAAAAVIALAILTVSGFESTNGLASWGLGLIAMGGLAWLVTDTKKETLVSKRS